MSERRACRLTGFSRSAWYRAKGHDVAKLWTHLKALAAHYPCYDHPMLHDMLRTEGVVHNRKRTYRVYRKKSLQVRTKRRKELPPPRNPMAVPNKANEHWSMEFVSDQLANGRRLKSSPVYFWPFPQEIDPCFTRSRHQLSTLRQVGILCLQKHIILRIYRLHSTPLQRVQFGGHIAFRLIKGASSSDT